jgi:hypothetical protein
MLTHPALAEQAHRAKASGERAPISGCLRLKWNVLRSQQQVSSRSGVMALPVAKSALWATNFPANDARVEPIPTAKLTVP